ncbi:putative aldo/keto reductase [Desulforapulum autotrophicum HRM2]|jgi:predicted aldo/keto reductase-like oxidoreductase|uniref:Aldo/keto reductase n=1 Tax=Desulforapulum autotrophicum (strain ATCC 43914 / DSM 3382 / VKM B-1955 / HRM2) TaxID=177437 RepID=C0QGQ2_DESAH|nr:aldo/keto reductase [Desulforapulum autotrophicum]ACN13527.1 putative aldo/keto reductase [Desulforapulum autotrophicum HRM2]
MLYRKIPKTGDRLSILGFGCMRLPVKAGRIDEARATRQIRSAIDRGVNYLDTAWPYHGGESEPFLGQALAGGYREKVNIATKLPSWMIKTTEDMDRFFTAQLERLNTDHIDYYLLHALAGGVWDNLCRLGVMAFLDRLKDQGRIRNVGFSFHGTVADFKRIVDAYPWEFCQIQYNYLDEENQAGTEGLEYAAQRNLGIIIMEPLRGGNLGLPEPPPAIAPIWKAANINRTPVAWALRWIWNRPEVTVVLSGMNEEAHLKENLAIAEKALANSLDPAELAVVAQVSQKYKELMKVGCTGCGYCLPCPQGVSIPGCFEVYNKLHLFGNTEEAKFMYAVRMSGMLKDGEPAYASLCVECGECLEKCPQHLEIPTFLANVVEELEGPDLKEREAMARKVFKIS